jgi:hypothetical protein
MIFYRLGLRSFSAKLRVAEDLLSLLQFSALFLVTPSHHQSNETIAMKNISFRQAGASYCLGDLAGLPMITREH